MKIFLLIILLFQISAGEVLAASGGEGGGWGGIFWKAVNLAILLLLLYWFGKERVGEFFKGRKESIRRSIEEAEKAREEAERKHREYSKRLSNIEKQIEAIHRELREEGEKERDRIIEGAMKFAERIKEQAKVAAEQEAKKVMERVKGEVADLLVGLAEETLHKELTKEDQKRLVDDFLKRVELKRL